eukprot:Hpha_TRINITY_DN15486_c0_g1::TRINITY_DN15486_c0_g1_i3::g.173219::m.173219
MLLFVTALAVVAAGGKLACTSPLDCSLNGDCVLGFCECDAAWSGSKECDVMSFAVTRQNASLGYYNDTASSWGGIPILDTDTGIWHLFYAVMKNECTLGSWKTNSVVARASGPTAEGPFVFEEVVLENFAHNPTIRKIGDDYIIWFIGGWPTQAQHCGAKSSNATQSPATTGSPLRPPPKSDCTGSPEWEKSCGPEMPGPNHDTCGPDNNAGCGLALASSKSLFGPWTVQRLIIEDRWNSDSLYCAYTNPSPFVYVDGTILMAFNAGFCDDNLETVGLATAPHWKGPYTLQQDQPIHSTPLERAVHIAAGPANPQQPNALQRLGPPQVRGPVPVADRTWLAPSCS